LQGKFEHKDYARALGKGVGTVANFISTHRDALEEKVSKYLELYVMGSSKLLNASAVQNLSKLLQSAAVDASDKTAFAKQQGELGNIKRIRWFKDEIAEIELGKTATEIASDLIGLNNKNSININNQNQQAIVVRTETI
jgi:hypothetical protein